MKRSEMIEKIAKIIREEIYHWSEDGAELILSMQEEAGMLPPEISDQFHNRISDGRPIESVYEWEPED